jgi:hypothetical protein
MDRDLDRAAPLDILVVQVGISDCPFRSRKISIDRAFFYLAGDLLDPCTGGKSACTPCVEL